MNEVSSISLASNEGMGETYTEEANVIGPVPRITNPIHVPIRNDRKSIIKERII